MRGADSPEAARRQLLDAAELVMSRPGVPTDPAWQKGYRDFVSELIDLVASGVCLSVNGLARAFAPRPATEQRFGPMIGTVADLLARHG